MSITRIKITDADLVALSGRIESGTHDAAVASLALAEALYRDPRGAKTLARIAGRPHGTFQRREALGLFVARKCVVMPSMPDDLTDEKSMKVWAREASAAATLHARMIDLPKARRAELADVMEGAEYAPSALAKIIKDEIAALKEPAVLVYADEVAKIADRITALADASGTDVATVLADLHLALTTAEEPEVAEETTEAVAA